MDFKDFGLAVLQLAVFMMFATAIIEVIKGVSAKGIWSLIKEFVLTITKGTAMSNETIKILNFIIALVMLRAFEFSALARILGIDTIKFGGFAYWLDYVATASVIYMGADYIFAWYKKIRGMAEDIDKPDAASGYSGSK
jgi:hypothetical protein